MARSTGIRWAYRMSITTQIRAVPICCRKLIVGRSMCSVPVRRVCSATRNRRDSTIASRMNTSRYTAAPTKVSGFR